MAAPKSVRFSLPDGYSLSTWHRGFAFTFSGKTYGASAIDGLTPAVLRLGDEDKAGPFPTVGAAVRGVIAHAGLVGEPAEALLRDITRLPEKFR